MRALIVVAFSMFILSCNEKIADISQAALIPKPVSAISAAGTFKLSSATGISLMDNSPELQGLAVYLSEKIKPATGFDLKPSADAASRIRIGLGAENPKLGREGYTLNISDTTVELTANTYEGVFRGIQTLLQLFPADIAKSTVQNRNWEIPAGSIVDYPAYSYRGSMLDVARHFFGVDDVKKYIDMLAAYKINILHLHLSDDQGWRIEIKSWPNLTVHGGSTEVGGGKGGFYTQEEYKDIVQYAASRYITIVPEIDMPGHTNAALSSYAELNCNDTATKLYTGIEVGFSSLCIKKELTYKFIDDVVRELSAITPGPYFHLGGDESHATPKDDYITFVNKIQAIPKKYGKRMIGWEETAQANIDSSNIVQYWTDPKYAAEAASKGAMMIISPASKAYLDQKYDSTTRIGLEWAARIEVDSAYMWSLANFVPGLAQKNILGVEAPLWAETIKTLDDIEYLVFPRLPGIAEIGWSPEGNRSWDEYKVRLAEHGPRMKAMGIDFYESKKVDWKK